MNNALFPGKTPKTPLKGAKSAVLEEKFFRGAHGRARQTALSGGGVLAVPSARRCRAGETDSHASDIGHWLGMTALRAVRADRVVRPYKEKRIPTPLFAPARMTGKPDIPGSKKSKPRRGLLFACRFFRTACPAPLPARRWHHPGSRAGDARRGCSAPAGWRWPGHSPPPPM